MKYRPFQMEDLMKTKFTDWFLTLLARVCHKNPWTRRTGVQNVHVCFPIIKWHELYYNAFGMIFNFAHTSVS